MSYYFDPINILDTSNSLGLGSGGSMTISGGISVGRDTFIGGNLSISGTATSFSDNILLINHNPSVSSDTGLLFQRYSNDITNNQNYSSIIYKESDDEFVFGYIQNDIQKELNSFSGYTALKANSLTLVSTNNSSFSENGSLNVLGGIKISRDAYLLGKMYITDSIVFNTTGNNQSNIELESTQSLYIGSNKAHIQVNGNDTLNNPGHIEMAFNTYMSFNYKSNGQIQNEVLRISTSGNIGIGTTTPNYKLHVQGDINLTGDIYKDGNIFSGSSQWETINSNIVYTSGNVGINTTTPNSNLEVNGSLFALSGSISQLQVTGVTSGVLLSNTSLVALGDSNTLGSLITTGGNVGIGTNLPIAKIDIVGGSQNTGASGSPLLAFQYFDGGYRHFIKSRHNSVLTFDNGNAIDIYLNKSVNSSDSSTPGTGNSLALSITGAGVGIGTSTPTSNLTVFANGISIFDPLTPTIAEFRGSTTSSTPETILRLGRGHSSGIAHAASAEFQVYRAYTNDVSANSGLNIKLGSLTNDNADKSVMTLVANGNVGIGTTVPSTNLDVNGSFNSLSATVGTLLANTSLSAIGDSNTLGNLFTTNGNIGIGTTDPSTLLHVNGEIFCNSLVSPSDERLKKDITLVETENCYNLVKNIPLKQYRWNTEMHNIHVPRNDTRLGWIAQDLEESFPQSVEHFSAYGITDCRTINMDQLIAVMYGTIQELQKKVEQLEQDNSNYYLNGR